MKFILGILLAIVVISGMNRQGTIFNLKRFGGILGYAIAKTLASNKNEINAVFYGYSIIQ